MDLSNLSDFYPLWNEMEGSTMDQGTGQLQSQLQLGSTTLQEHAQQRSTPAVLPSQPQFQLQPSNNQYQVHVASLTSSNSGPTTNGGNGQKNGSNNSSSNEKNANSTISSSWNSTSVPSQLQQQNQTNLNGSNGMVPGLNGNGIGTIPTAPFQHNANGFTASTEFWNQQMGMPQATNFPFTLGQQLNGQSYGHLMVYPFQMQGGGPPQSIQFINNQSSGCDGNTASGGQESIQQPESANTSNNTSQTPVPATGNDSGSSIARGQMLASSSSSKPTGSAPGSKDIKISQPLHGQGSKSGAVSMASFVVPGPVDLNPMTNQNFNVSFAQQGPFQWPKQDTSSGATLSQMQGQQVMVNPSRSSSVAAVESTNNGADDNATAGLKSDAPSEMRLRQLRERNNREQKRAQKITELIDTLRKTMVDGGWKTEVKSKSSTLDQIKTYIEHLQGANQEKTNQVKEARTKLDEARVRVRERESAKLQNAAEGGSDPESVMSSLTSDSTSSNRRKGLAGARRPSEKDRSSSARCKRSAARMQHEGEDNQGQASPNGKSCHKSRCKRPRPSSADSSKSSEMESCETNQANKDASDTQRSSAEDNDAEQKLPAHDEGRPDNINTDNRSLSRMSDVTSAREETDSNIAIAPGTNSASDKADGGAGAGGTTVARSSSREDTTVLVPEIKIVNRKRSHSHHKRKGRIKAAKFAHSCLQESLSSLDEEFKLNYREVFLMSNVPQLIATVTGRIVAWNHFFIALSGLRSREVKRMTIFSIVDIDRLSSLFELVAAALKGSKYRSPSDGASGRNNKKSHIGSSVGTNNSKGEVSALTPASGCGNSSSGSSGDGTGEKAEDSSKDGGSASTNKKQEVPSVVQNKEAKAAAAPPAPEPVEERSRVEDYRSVTLPCIDFESFRHAENLKEGAKMREFCGIPTGQVYMTVTLMDDEEETKRCFHCAFTNTEPTKDSVGSVSQSLITEMFSVKRGASTPNQNGVNNSDVQVQEQLPKAKRMANSHESEENPK